MLFSNIKTQGNQFSGLSLLLFISRMLLSLGCCITSLKLLRIPVGAFSVAAVVAKVRRRE